MFLVRSLNPQWLSNSWLVADHDGGSAVLIDSGGPMESILEAVQTHRLDLSHVLCTHHHHDHVAHNADYRRRFGCSVCGHRNEESLFGGLDQTLDHGDELVCGDLHVRALHIPGHTSGQLAFLINEERVFTGDTLFRGSVGGTRAPDHTDYADLKESIMGTLMALPPDMPVHPGHTESTIIGREWEENPFIRLWRGLDPAAAQRCQAYGRPAALLLSARDYDGGRKCLVRFDEGEVLDIVPGSQVVANT